MPRQRRSHTIRYMGTGAPYSSKVLATAPLVYFPLNELAGATAINYGTLAAADGTYGGVTLAAVAAPKSGLAPSWDGANDYCDIYTAALDGASWRQLGSAMVWLKIGAVGVWTDNTYRRALYILQDGNNMLYFDKTGVPGANSLRGVYIANAAGLVAAAASLDGSLVWNQLIMTWSKAADALIIYVNGVKEGATVIGLGAWPAGGLDINQTNIGSETHAGAGVWSGYLAHVAVWDRVLSATEVTALYAGGA